jgi:Tol biopolymer transport system component
VLVEGAASPAYATSGHLLYLKLGVLWAAPFDRSRLQVTGPGAPIIDGVLQSAQIANNTIDTGAGQYAISETGTIVYLPGLLLPPDLKTIVWTDRKGRTEPSGFNPGQFFQVRISPDGQRIAAADQSPSNILVLDRPSKVVQQLPHPGFNVSAWTRDSSRIIFSWAEGGPRNVFWQRADGSGSAEPLSSGPNSQLPGPLLADGSAILMVQNQGSVSSARADIFRLDLNPSRHATPILQESFSEAYPDLSPDNRWLAYASTESGSWEVYVRPYPALDQKRAVSSGGGYMPAWSRDGRELYYMRGASKASDQDIIMAVDVDSRSGFQANTPHELFRGHFVLSNSTRTYDVAPDGRFLMVTRGASNEQRSPSLRIVLNWTEELKRLVPTK